MSKKVTALLVGVLASLALAAGTMQGCGGGSGGDFQSVCMKACEKAASCAPDAGTTNVMSCKTACSQLHCTNEAAIAARTQECLNMADCAAAEACGQTIPACQIGTGTGGSGGTSGGGGTGGSGSGWTCLESADGCACAPGAGGGQSACTGTYNCCFTVSSGGAEGCSCATAAATDCATAAMSLNGTVVAHCPP